MILHPHTIGGVTEAALGAVPGKRGVRVRNFTGHSGLHRYGERLVKTICFIVVRERLRNGMV